MKKFLKEVAVQVAASAAFVALDQAVRTVVSQKLKGVMAKKEDESK